MKIKGNQFNNKHQLSNLNRYLKLINKNLKTLKKDHNNQLNKKKIYKTRNKVIINKIISIKIIQYNKVLIKYQITIKRIIKKLKMILKMD